MAKPICDYRLRISTTVLLNGGFFNTGRVVRGLGSWGDGSNIAIMTDMTERPTLNLSYNMNGVAMRQEFQLVRTRPHFGGFRWWIVCHGHRVVNLYLGRFGFKCRKCYGLAYKSQQEAHGRGKAVDSMRDFNVAFPKKDPDKIRYKTWRGKPTKRWQRAEDRQLKLIRKIIANNH